MILKNHYMFFQCRECQKFVMYDCRDEEAWQAIMHWNVSMSSKCLDCWGYVEKMAGPISYADEKKEGVVNE